MRCTVDRISVHFDLFLDLVELSDVITDGILQALLDCLFSLGVTKNFWKTIGLVWLVMVLL